MLLVAGFVEVARRLPARLWSAWNAAEYFGNPGIDKYGLASRFDLPVVPCSRSRLVTDSHQPPGCLELLDEIVSIRRGLRQLQLLELPQRLRPMAFPTPIRPAFRFP